MAAKDTDLETQHAVALKDFIHASVVGDGKGAAGLVTAGVHGWSPTLDVSSRDELLAAFADRLGTFADVDVEIDPVAVTTESAIAEWRFSAAPGAGFWLDGENRPAAGRRVGVAGAPLPGFDGDRIKAFRHYFDDTALVEQLLEPV